MKRDMRVYIEDILESIARIEGVETAIASESSLRKDWLKPKEDEAWADL